MQWKKLLFYIPLLTLYGIYGEKNKGWSIHQSRNGNAATHQSERNKIEILWTHIKTGKHHRKFIGWHGHFFPIPKVHVNLLYFIICIKFCDSSLSGCYLVVYKYCCLYCHEIFSYITDVCNRMLKIPLEMYHLNGTMNMITLVTMYKVKG